MVDASGNVVWEAAYLPFGKARIITADIANNLRFPGQYFDAETGLHYNWNRYYHPELGRYVTADPIGLEGGINLYAYVNGNPVNWVDLNGQIPIIGIIPIIWEIIETSLSAYDTYDTASTVLDPCSSRGEKATTIGLYTMGIILPGGGYSKIDDAARASKRGTKFWSKAEFKGQKVFQRDDLINPKLVDARGRTNLQRMEKGLAPIGPDGKSMNLHQTLQTNDSALAEMTQTFHQQNSKTIHINPNTTPSGIDRNAFNQLRKDYWINRANDFR